MKRGSITHRVAIGAALSVLAPLAAAAKEIFSFERGGNHDLFRPRREAGATGPARTSRRTASMDKRDAVKRRNVLRNRRAHR